jgi:hypothetical protein
MSTDTNQSIFEQRYSRQLASSVTDELITDNRIKADEYDDVVTLIDGMFTQADDAWKSYMQSRISNSVAAASASKPKPRKKPSTQRKLSAYNMFVNSESAAVRKDLGDGAKVRGAVMTEVGKRWKALDADGRAPYVSQAAEVNAKRETAQAAEHVTPVTPPTNYDELVGPYPGTFARGSAGNRRFKTLADAVNAMYDNPKAAAITQLESGNFVLRAGWKYLKAGLTNVDTNGNATPGFVYNANTPECTWVRKSAMIQFNENGPFTKSDPFCEPADAAPSVNAATAVPSVNAATAVPSVNVATAVPSVNVATAVPSVNVATAVPSVNVATAVPSVNAATAVPSVNVATAVPSVNAAKTALYK